MIRIAAVDPDQTKIRNILHSLQMIILPSDKVLLPDDDYWWLAYDENGVPIAFASLTPSAQFQNTGYLSRSGVRWTHRGNGLQKRLIRARATKARKLDWTHLISDTYENPASARSLIACGFKPYMPSNPWGAKGVAYWILKL